MMPMLALIGVLFGLACTAWPAAMRHVLLFQEWLWADTSRSDRLLPDWAIRCLGVACIIASLALLATAPDLPS